MTRKRPYTGYQSFQYLERGVDFKPFRLANQINRVDSSGPHLDAAQTSRVNQILAGNVVVSLHDHVTCLPEDLRELADYRIQGRDWIGYEGLSASCLDAVFDAPAVGTALMNSRFGWKWEDAVWDLAMRQSDIAHQDFLIRTERLADIHRAKAQGQLAFISSLEAATPIENELDRLDVLYGVGVRMIGISYTQSNALGGGFGDTGDAGLTDFGRAAVRRMNRLGMAIDVAHAGDQTSLDTIELSEHPVFISHTGARSLWDSLRLKPDDVLTACANRGGVIGIEAAPNTTVTAGTPRHSLESFMEHFEYVAGLVGIDHVAFGPDTVFGDHVNYTRGFSRWPASANTSVSRGVPTAPAVDFVDGIENPSEAFVNIVGWLVNHDYSDDEISKVIGANILRALSEVWV